MKSNNTQNIKLKNNNNSKNKGKIEILTQIIDIDELVKTKKNNIFD